MSQALWDFQPVGGYGGLGSPEWLSRKGSFGGGPSGTGYTLMGKGVSRGGIQAAVAITRPNVVKVIAFTLGGLVGLGYYV